MDAGHVMSAKGPAHDDDHRTPACPAGDCEWCDSIRRMVADSPPMTPEQIRRVARLLTMP